MNNLTFLKNTKKYLQKTESNSLRKLGEIVARIRRFNLNKEEADLGAEILSIVEIRLNKPFTIQVKNAFDFTIDKESTNLATGFCVESDSEVIQQARKCSVDLSDEEIIKRFRNLANFYISVESQNKTGFFNARNIILVDKDVFGLV